MSAHQTLSDDIQARKDALDPAQSFIVQAPAGSGKTELLIQRMLSLLARVEHPSEILAITFTKKAAGEMRERLFAALAAAREMDEPQQSPARERWHLARAVVARDAEKKWQLVERPKLLNIDTFDAFSLRITKLAPLSLDGASAGLANLSQDASVQHREAARRALLDPDDTQSLQAASSLLAALDNRVDDIIALIADLLGKRAQWMDHLIDDSDESIAQMRNIVVQSLEAELANAQTLWPQRLTTQVGALCSHAAENIDNGEKKTWLSELTSFDFASHDIASLSNWVNASNFLITSSTPFGWRKSYTKNDGFPAASDKGISAEEKAGRTEAKAAITSLIADVSSIDDSELLRESLLRARSLPNAEAITAHEPILRAALRVLKLASAELLLIERAAAITDFSGVALAAKHALLNFRDEVFGRLDAQIAHILVDEFQDTNPAQSALIESLVDDWSTNEGRTLFLVGDPMQSIYGFRDADVGIFLDAWANGVANLKLQRLKLAANYRSQRPIVDWVNDRMSEVFARRASDQSTPRIAFAHAVAIRDDAPAIAHDFVHVFDDIEDEVSAIVADISRVRGESPKASVAVIVRAKSHATEILQALQAANLPFEAREMSRWHHRPLIRDLMSLTYVLAQPSDRLSWYAWLRSPMIGLSLATFARLSEWQQSTKTAMPAPLYDSAFLQFIANDDVDEAKRIATATAALQLASNREDLGQLAERVHAVFRFCGGDLIANTPHECLEVEDYFSFLDAQCASGFLPARDAFERALRDRFQSFASISNTSTSSPPIELLTIHKAKGLEWDYVYLPQWNRRSPAEKRHLVVWDFVRQSQNSSSDRRQSLSRISRASTQLLVAAKEARRKTENSVFQFVQDRRVAARKEEAKRLLYVAVTRTREGLFISGSASEPGSGSLAALMQWPAATASAEPSNNNVTSSASKRRIMTTSLLRFEPPFVATDVESTTSRKTNLSRSGKAANESSADEINATRNNEIALGIVGHTLIEGLARAMRADSPFSPSPSFLSRRLMREGMTNDAIDWAARELLSTIAVMKTSKHFSFIHDAAHTETANELALAVAQNDSVQTLRVDRTFVDRDDTRWIVDYKFSATTARDEQDIVSWLDAQKRHHSAQLSAYASAFLAIEANRRVRCALYFPRVDRFIFW